MGPADGSLAGARVTPSSTTLPDPEGRGAVAMAATWLRAGASPSACVGGALKSSSRMTGPGGADGTDFVRGGLAWRAESAEHPVKDRHRRVTTGKVGQQLI